MGSTGVDSGPVIMRRLLQATITALGTAPALSLDSLTAVASLLAGICLQVDQDDNESLEHDRDLGDGERERMDGLGLRRHLAAGLTRALSQLMSRVALAALFTTGGSQAMHALSPLWRVPIGEDRGMARARNAIAAAVDFMCVTVLPPLVRPTFAPKMTHDEEDHENNPTIIRS